jgi:hypothetical protein
VACVVTPAQALLVIVPLDSRLGIEAMVSNRFVAGINNAAVKHELAFCAAIRHTA